MVGGVGLGPVGTTKEDGEGVNGADDGEGVNEAEKEGDELGFVRPHNTSNSKTMYANRTNAMISDGSLTDFLRRGKIAYRPSWRQVRLRVRIRTLYPYPYQVHGRRVRLIDSLTMWELPFGK